jgi:tellurite resistance protein
VSSSDESDGVSVDEQDFLSNTMNGDSYVSPAVQRARDDQLEKEMLENRQKSEELQTFIEDQVAQVFQTYLRDYFQKELTLLRLSCPLI